MLENDKAIVKLIELALDEDHCVNDLTSKLTVPEDSASTAEILAREELILCGTGLIDMIFAGLGVRVDTELLCQDGDALTEGQVIASLSGPTQTILVAERTILNFMQKLSGVATFTNKIVKHAQGIKVLDTRKTTPGWRKLEKYAVVTGGGANHRFNLEDMILIKDNHIDASGKNIKAVLDYVNAHKPDDIKVEVEVRDLEELIAALASHCDIVMLDNMNDVEIANALNLVSAVESPPEVEVSGGISLERLAILKELGVTMVSMGALTTQATNVDISMNIKVRV